MKEESLWQLASNGQLSVAYEYLSKGGMTASSSAEGSNSQKSEILHTLIRHIKNCSKNPQQSAWAW